ncbi:hypothetical protein CAUPRSCDRAFT_12841 [Caulochytrium protostelioides]|uniref:Uncharacterized protein n=1 Tax=Caulochytrium protostelioides TaxID=1555241 RepID=A0A4P9WTY9_9FUNG|nr:hypothetical protein CAUPRSCDRAFT_12841 [Caulochytrium protostelioides]
MCLVVSAIPPNGPSQSRVSNDSLGHPVSNGPNQHLNDPHVALGPHSEGSNRMTTPEFWDSFYGNGDDGSPPVSPPPETARTLGHNLASLSTDPTDPAIPFTVSDQSHGSNDFGRAVPNDADFWRSFYHQDDVASQPDVESDDRFDFEFGENFSENGNDGPPPENPRTSAHNLASHSPSGGFFDPPEALPEDPSEAHTVTEYSMGAQQLRQGKEYGDRAGTLPEYLRCITPLADRCKPSSSSET